jgi:Flp pilus assembly pilin Flp
MARTVAEMTASVRALRAWVQWALPEPEAGQGLAEYSVILVLVAVLCVTALSAIGMRVSAMLSVLDGVF